MKTIALYNPASGSVTTEGKDRLRAALEAADVREADVIEIDCSDFHGQLSRLSAQSPDLFVVWGGDGTLRSALAVAGQTTPNLLLLPGGTMNLLTRSIHGDKAWDVVLKDVLAGPRRRTIPAGRVDQEHFYCAMLAGAPARFAEARESLRRGELVKAASEARVALDTLNSLHLDASYRDGYSFGHERLPSTSVIGALVGPVAKGEGMEIAALSAPSAGAALNVVWSSFLSDWRNAPGVTVVPARSLTIENPEGGDIPVIIDGEAIEAGSRVKVRFVEEAAQCLTAA
ncbi:MAG TPA: diacylglycerol kinase family protein [Hyphomonadaceae bacterium]|nr:diacylglycerol kinase family protein [Hyphomonadaceae bacterium]